MLCVVGVYCVEISIECGLFNIANLLIALYKYLELSGNIIFHIVNFRLCGLKRSLEVCLEYN